MSRLLPTVILLIATGCASTGLQTLDVSELPLVKEKPAEVPSRVIPVWTDTVLHRGGKTVRGLGGRVIFYGATGDTPIKVDGAVVVYAWDDTAGRGQEAPDRKYMFKADSMEKHYSPSKIGHSYSFWLPWDAVGGETKHVTLVTRFVSLAGGEVTSNAANVVLPGPMTSLAREPKRPRSESSEDVFEPRKLDAVSQRRPIQQLGFEEVAPTADLRPESSRTTTIDLPLHLARGPQVDMLDSDGDGGPRERDSLSVTDFESPVASVPAESQSIDAGAPGRPPSRFGPRTLPVRSSRSTRQSASREPIQRDRLGLRRGSSRKQRSPRVSVQKKIAQDAAEAKARRADAWGQYQTTDLGRD